MLRWQLTDESELDRNNQGLGFQMVLVRDARKEYKGPEGHANCSNLACDPRPAALVFWPKGGFDASAWPGAALVLLKGESKNS